VGQKDDQLRRNAKGKLLAGVRAPTWPPMMMV